MDFSIELEKGQVLQGMINSPGEGARGVIVLVHGLGEHTKRFEKWAKLFVQEGYAFTGVDLPGHGLSSGRKGHIKNEKVLDRMINILLESCKKTFPGIPVYLYGQSLGGVIVLNYLLRNDPKIKGAIVTSPWLRLSFEPSRVKVVLASTLKNFIPGFVQSSGLNTSHLSHDPVEVEKYRSDRLVHDRISVGLFVLTVNAGIYSLKHAADLRVPTLLMHGSEDMITSPEASREFAEKSEMAEFKLWEGGYHELHNEPFREEVFRYIITWLNKKSV